MISLEKVVGVSFPPLASVSFPLEPIERELYEHHPEMWTCACWILHGQSRPIAEKSKIKSLHNCIENGGYWDRGYSELFL